MESSKHSGINVNVVSLNPKSGQDSCGTVSIPSYVTHLRKCSEAQMIVEGRPIEIWELTVPPDNKYLSDWAYSFRQRYCPDSEIDELREGTGLSRADYLIQIIFPDQSKPPGPGIRSGDFAELLISDFLEHMLGYWVPRGKYAEKATRDESVKGVDILGFKMVTANGESPKDSLLAFEVKAQCGGGKYGGQLQKAIDDSSKDYFRSAFTLNATKRRLLKNGKKEQALIVQRFQNLADKPYVYKSGAAAVLSDEAYDEGSIITSTSLAQHSNQGNLELLVICGKELMTLVHTLYKKAADEA